MAARPQEQILADFLAGTGRAGRLRRNLAANQHRNWLLAIVLHSFRRFAEKAELTDLEASVIKAFRDNGFDDAELTRKGRLAARLDDTVRAELFGSGFAALAGRTPYSRQDLAAEAPGIVRTTLARPNVTVVDVAGIHSGRSALGDVRLPADQVLREYSSSMTVAIEEGAKASAAKSTGSTFSIKATKFRCNQRGTDSVFDPKCEYYFIFGTVAGSTQFTTQSQVFGNVDTGETRTFGTPDGVLWGPNGLAEPLVPGEIGILVSVWEHDSGNVTETRAAVASAFAATAGILALTGVAAWVGAVTLAVGGVVAWLLGFMDDDHVGDTTFDFDGLTLAKQLSSVGSSVPTVRRVTNAKDDLTVTVTATRVT
jgi:hypothetical protein